jgi:drug/metabolite transporter (DMT)-like permease
VQSGDGSSQGGLGVKAILLGILASLFFAMTFVLNRMMSLDGGSWVWSASLRFLFMLPVLAAIVLRRQKLGLLVSELRQRPWQWILWSTVGFGLFYIPLCVASAYSPGWLVAGTWQFTIIAGSLIVPLFSETVHTPTGVRKVRKRIPRRGLVLSSLIVVGIVLLEGQQARIVSMSSLALGSVPILFAAFAYPLGNRKMMELCGARVGAVERVLGMTIASLPLWLLLCLCGLFTVGPPSTKQMVQALVVALLSGVIATIIFFTATDLTRGNVQQLAAVEATQSGEVVFALLAELVLIPGTKVTGWDLAGVGLVVAGIILHSLATHGPKTTNDMTVQA